jgi:hypothetical protein
VVLPEHGLPAILSRRGSGETATIFAEDAGGFHFALRAVSADERGNFQFPADAVGVRGCSY